MAKARKVARKTTPRKATRRAAMNRGTAKKLLLRRKRVVASGAAGAKAAPAVPTGAVTPNPQPPAAAPRIPSALEAGPRPPGEGQPITERDYPEFRAHLQAARVFNAVGFL